MNATAIVLAAGSGRRMEGCVADKVLAPLAGMPVVTRAVARLLESGIFNSLRIVVRDPSQAAAIREALAVLPAAAIETCCVNGGERRQDSVLNALEADAAAADYAFIHDCARPLVDPDAVRALARLVDPGCGAALARPVTDTVKRRAAGASSSEPLLLEDLERERLVAMETPQAFPLEAIRAAYRGIAAAGGEVTDDVAAAARHGLPVRLLIAGAPNPKITTPADLAYAEWLLSR